MLNQVSPHVKATAPLRSLQVCDEELVQSSLICFYYLNPQSHLGLMHGIPVILIKPINFCQIHRFH